MSVTQKYLLSGGSTVLISGGMASLANNALCSGAAFDNTQGATGDGYTLADMELYVSGMGGAATANTAVSVWLLSTQDGSNYEDGSTTVTPARLPDVIFPVRAVSGAQRIIRRLAAPQGVWIPLLKNDGTGQTITSGSLSYRGATEQGI